MISIIVALDENNGIGKDNKLLWHLPNDLKHFKKLTMDHAIIMGRKTFEMDGFPLKDRLHVILSRDNTYDTKGHFKHSSIHEAIEDVKSINVDIFIIGGAQIYKQAIETNLIDRLIVTHVKASLDADTFFPAITDEWIETSRENHKADDKHAYDYSFVTYENNV